uniref:Amine oxidase domain-containing protein n=1 Tax=Physcomitrium patens TaxID=3218 RepID=A0A7I4CX85_PHYPA
MQWLWQLVQLCEHWLIRRGLCATFWIWTSFHLRWGCREVLYDRTSEGKTYVTGLVMTKATEKQIVKADAYVAACDVPGIHRLLPKPWREWEFFDNIYKLLGVPVVTVQLRFNGWVTEMQDLEASRQLQRAVGLDNLLYSADADFSCFADLALTSPEDYFKEGEGSLIQAVLTPGDPYMPLSNEQVVKNVHEQVLRLFPSANELEMTWSSVVKIGQSLYREAPGMDLFRPDQKTPVSNFFLSGSYTKQDYIDSMEGATLSGRQTSARINEVGPFLHDLRHKVAKTKSEASPGSATDELTFV